MSGDTKRSTSQDTSGNTSRETSRGTRRSTSRAADGLARPRPSQIRTPLAQATPKEKALIDSLLSLVQLGSSPEHRRPAASDAASWFDFGDSPAKMPETMAIVPFEPSTSDGWAAIPDISCLESDDGDDPLRGQVASWWGGAGGFLDQVDLDLVARAAAAPPLDPSHHGISKRAKGKRTGGLKVEALFLALRHLAMPPPVSVRLGLFACAFTGAIVHVLASDESSFRETHSEV